MSAASRWRIACALFLLADNPTQAATTFSVVNKDTAGIGLNDTTSVTPVGGNTATTLGAARLNVLKEAGRIWGLRLNSSQTIVMDTQFSAQTCTTTSGVLASAGPVVFFTSSAQPNVLLPAALADALTGTNNNSRDDISITINSNVGSGSSCLNGKSFYLGFDHNNGSNIDLLNVLLHEIAHGLGFVSLTDSTGAALVAGKFTGFEQFVYSETTGKFWPAMTDAERAMATISPGAVTFNSPSVNSNLSVFTTNTGLSSPGSHLRLYTPSTYSDGSSVSHWDTVASPNLLMEPYITANPLGSTDLTGCVLRDIGWSNAYCPDAVPIAQGQTVNTNENVPVQITLSGTGADSARTLSYSIVTAPTLGALTSTGGATFFYTPNANANGTDSFTFQISDGIRTSNTAIEIISIAAVNSAPVANAQTVTTTQGAAINITLSASDVDSPTLTYVVATSPTHGTLSGTAPNLTYTPDTSFTGTDSFIFHANDGALDSNNATVTVKVNAAPASSGSHGGGAFDELMLLSLGLLMASRRRLTTYHRSRD
jgi:hypothetical protein